ncbi:FtsQ Cell division septal protein [Candidatus Planktophila vernalis]|uniref:cell division protein FtsQ/DivIB n=1 Tax=Candidatus Planktophila vernalis TaxID=1884907 RepID=UPI003CE9747A
MKNKRLIALATVIFVGAASYALGWSTLFTVSSVEVTGTDQRLPQSIKVGEKLARVEPRAVAATYEKFAFVQDAQVSRNWISGKVTISITSRTPVAIFNNQAIDDSGKAFVVKGQLPAALPQIQASSVEIAVTAVEFMKSLPQEIRSNLKILKVRSTGAYVMDVDVQGRKVEVRWGFATENELKAKVYKALLEQPENAKLKRMDLSAPHAPIVK